MPNLSGHMTTLDAINDMLASIGESPVSLGDQVEEADIATALLIKSSRKVQMAGWHCNTIRGRTLSVDVNGRFLLPTNTLKVDTSDPRGTRRTGSPPHSSFVDAVMRRDLADTGWLLFDRQNDTEIWTDPLTLTVDIVEFMEFDNLAPSLQVYVTAIATRRFQTENMGSRTLAKFTQQEVDEAFAQALQDDTENEDPNILRDSPTVFDMTYRRNPRWGR